MHYYFLYDDKLELTSTSKVIKINNKKIGIDVKTNGGYIIVPPSSNENGKYKWINHPKDTKIINFPEWIYKLILDSK